MTTPTATMTRSRAREPFERAKRTIAPPVDIYETDQSFVVLADMPGVRPDGLEVTAERDTLSIRGRTDQPNEEPDYQEFVLSEYRRTFALTEDLDISQVSAVLKDGVLKIQIAKSARMQPKRIPIQSE
jgi:HSP20 family molecular chaperone IbpA